MKETIQVLVTILYEVYSLYMLSLWYMRRASFCMLWFAISCNVAAMFFTRQKIWMFGEAFIQFLKSWTKADNLVTHRSEEPGTINNYVLTSRTICMVSLNFINISMNDCRIHSRHSCLHIDFMNSLGLFKNSSSIFLNESIL